MGLLTTDLKYDASRTLFEVSDSIDLARINRYCAEMEAQLSQQFAADHIAPNQVSFQRFGDMRYVGQGYELKVALPAAALSEASLAALWEDFHATHKREYGHAFRASAIEIVNLMVTGAGTMPKLTQLKSPPTSTLADARLRSSTCIFRVEGRLQEFDTPFYQRALLPVGEAFAGPAIILQKDSTTVVPPGSSACVHASGSIVITLEAKP
jgi:N-methylhydantoinase A